MGIVSRSGWGIWAREVNVLGWEGDGAWRQGMREEGGGDVVVHVFYREMLPVEWMMCMCDDFTHPLCY